MTINRWVVRLALMKDDILSIIMITLTTATFISFYPSGVTAVEVAPRISDREIVERLSRLDEGQRRLEGRIDALERHMNQRFDDIKWFLGIMIGTLLVINTGVLGYVLRRQGILEKSI